MSSKKLSALRVPISNVIKRVLNGFATPNLVSGNATKHIVGDNINVTKHYVGSMVRFDTLFCRDIQTDLGF